MIQTKQVNIDWNNISFAHVFFFSEQTINTEELLLVWLLIETSHVCLRGIKKDV